MKHGRGVRRRTRDSAGHRYLLYLPAAHDRSTRVLVLVHGKSGGAEELVEIFRQNADLHGAMLVAPVFHDGTFPQFHQLGLNAATDGGRRPDIALRRILDDVSRLTQVATHRVHIYGHSRGAQFAHRYAMAFPDAVLRCVISAAGWYTLPDPSASFPHGTKVNRKLRSVEPDLDRFLLVPVCVIVGAKDTDRDSKLKKSVRIDSAQGLTRLERARTWVDAVSVAARERGLVPNARLHVMPNAGHELSDLVAHGLLDVVASEHFFA